MDESKWEDVSIYRRGDKERIPRVFHVKSGLLTIQIHRNINFPKDMWFLSCPAINISQKALQNKELNAAKIEAIGVVNAVINELQISLLEIAKNTG